MSFNLTTGQMIDRLDIGEVAETPVEDGNLLVKRSNEGFYFCDDEYIPLKPFNIHAVIHKLKWRIIPKFISFEEAIEAYKAGLTIESFLGNSEEPWAGYSKKATIEQTISFEEIINGKWRMKVEVE